MLPYQPNPEFLARLSAAVGDEAERQGDYRLYRRYYDGQQNSQLPAQSDKLAKYVNFRANLCEVVIDALTERLTVTGFTGTGPQAKAAVDWCDELWQSERLDDVAATVHHEAALCGDAFIIVEWDNDEGEPRICYNPAHLISVKYQDTGNRVLAWATKRWESPDLKTRYLNRYLPDRIERYYTTVSKEGAYSDADWRPFSGDGLPPVLPWVDAHGDPLGVPVIHFRNRARGDAYGRSEIANVIPLQDSINKTLVDLLLVLDTQGWPQRWVRGVEPPGGFQVGPGRVWTSNHPQFAAGELSSASPDGLLSALNQLVKTAAALSRTPAYMFDIEGGRIASGEALKTAEAPLAKKARDRQRSLGDAWEDVFTLALRLDAAFGTGDWDTDEGVTLQTTWQDPELRNDLALAQAVTTKAPYISRKEILRLFGYSAEQITNIIAEMDEDDKAKQNTGGALLDMFRAPGGDAAPGATRAPVPGGQEFTRNPDNNR